MCMWQLAQIIHSPGVSRSLGNLISFFQLLSPSLSVCVYHNKLCRVITHALIEGPTTLQPTLITSASSAAYTQ